SFVVVESAPDAVNGSGFEGVFEALLADGAAAADLLGFGGFGSAVDEEDVAVDTQAGGVVAPGGVVFGGENVVVRERGRSAHAAPSRRFRRPASSRSCRFSPPHMPNIWLVSRA